ncbi:MAG: hypothetical protein IPP72_12330 [Chitinophagaceae bacterium]|nr:hypothetical protein [Chitinophagaceae bacterium]
MKQSLIITAILCFTLGETFSVISKKEKAEQKAASYCCIKVCGQQQANQAAVNAEPEPFIPMVNLLGYD